MDLPTLVEACVATVESAQSQSTTDAQFLDACRIQLEPYIYHSLIQRYGPALDAFWATYTPPKKARGAFVLVERRPHPNAWFLLRNIAWANAGCSIYIFCSNENRAFFETLLGDKLPHVHLIEWFQGPATRDEGKAQYNQTFKNPSFYSMVDAEYMCTVQMDCFFRRQFTDELWRGDYWGSPWGWAPTSPGGGGITVRKLASMLRVCALDPKEGVADAEDCWVAARAVRLGMSFPSFEERRELLVENTPSLGPQGPIGVHQCWTFLHNFGIDNKPLFHYTLQNLLTLSIQ